MNLPEPLPFTAIWGPPRSGTTWLGQIFDSHPAVAYRFQPLFSYAFKGAVTRDTPPAGVKRFLSDLAATQDDFVLQQTKREQGLVPAFTKTEPVHLFFKEVRHLDLAEHFLETMPGSRAIGILRHPCATINSWLKTPREFLPEWDWRKEWRLAPSKNHSRPEEYNGFERWLWTAQHFLDLAASHPDRFVLVRYEELVDNPHKVLRNLFLDRGLYPGEQTEEFVRASQAREMEHPDSIFRKPEVKDRWRQELPAEIRDAILGDCAGTRLEQFCR